METEKQIDRRKFIQSASLLAVAVPVTFSLANCKPKSASEPKKDDKAKAPDKKAETTQTKSEPEQSDAPEKDVPAKGDAKKVIDEFVGKNPVSRTKVKLIAPKIAENGAIVPVTAEVDSPMSKDNMIKEMIIVIDKNPVPLVAKINFTPESGKAYFSARMRMGQTTQVRAYAKSHDNKIFYANKSVKVTIGGCG